MKEAQLKIQVKSAKKDFIVQIAGDRQVFASKQEMENGIEPFRDIAIVKTQVSVANTESGSSSEEYTSEEEPTYSPGANEIKLSKCQIKITPERNLLATSQNSEKVMYLQNLLDDYALKFEESADLVTISGVQSLENYETFIRRLTYIVLNIGEVEPAKLDVLKNKKFFLSCTRLDSNIETNVILVQVSVSRKA